MKKHLTLLLTLLYTVAAMTVMILFFLNRDASAEVLADGLNPDGILYMDDFLYSEGGSSRRDYFCIPLENGVSGEDVVVTNDLYGRKVTVELPVKENDFYYRNSLTGNRNHITGIEFSLTDSGVCFELTLDTLLETKYIIEDGRLYLKPERPRDLYRHIVLIDPGHGGADEGTFAYSLAEKDILLSVCSKIPKSEDPDIRYFFTRTADVSRSDSERLATAAALEPDLIISLHTNADRSTRITRGCRVLYSDPSLSEEAVRFSSILSEKTGITGLGAAEDSYSGLLKETDFPCLLVQLGYMTNKAEAEYMSGEEYQSRAAEAIGDFLKEWFEGVKQPEN